VEELALNAGVGRGVFWGLMAAGAVVTVLVVAVLVGYLVGHNTHTVTKTVTQDTAQVRSVPVATSPVSFG
jgi:peptide methionine sulfoxide reductase MsrA